MTESVEPPFRHRQTVRFGDVDLAGMVYYPRLIHYFHVAMEAFFAEVAGLGYDELVRDHGLGLPTVRLEVDFHRPLRYGDEIEVEVTIESIGRTSVIWRQRIFRPAAAEPAAQARIVTVNMDLEAQEKRAVPDWLRERLG